MRPQEQEQQQQQMNEKIQGIKSVTKNKMKNKSSTNEVNESRLTRQVARRRKLQNDQSTSAGKYNFTKMAF